MVLEVKDIVYHYKANKDKNVLSGISYGFEEGTVYAILGTSGSGKTTFLSLLAGLDVPVSGSVLYEGQEVVKKGLNIHRKRHVSLVFQNYNLIDYLTPKENVMLGGDKDPEKLLEDVGIPKEDWNRNVLQLSGGQQQRVAIARALASPAKVLLADEPTGNLDPATAWDIMTLLEEINKRGTTVVIATHAKDIVDQMQKRVITLENGHIIRDKRGGYSDEI